MTDRNDLPGPKGHGPHLAADWNGWPVALGIADDIPELQKHWILFEQLLHLAQEIALREGAICRRAFRQLLGANQYAQAEDERAAAAAQAKGRLRRPPGREPEILKAGRNGHFECYSNGGQVIAADALGPSSRTKPLTQSHC